MQKPNLEITQAYHSNSVFEDDPSKAHIFDEMLNLFVSGSSNVYSIYGLSSEIVSAVWAKCSRTQKDIRYILHEHLKEMYDTDPEFKSYVDLMQKAKLTYKSGLGDTKSRKFIGRYVGEYGDKSIHKLNIVSGAISQLSILAAKEVWESRYYAGIESSTRYLDFAKGSKIPFFIDPKLSEYNLKDKYISAMTSIFSLYSSCINEYGILLREKFKYQNGLSESIFNTKVYDDLRIILPLSTFTQLSFAVNALALSSQIARFHEHPLGEVRRLGEEMWADVYNNYPTAMSRVTRDIEIRSHKNQVLSSLSSLFSRFDRKENKTRRTGVDILRYDSDGVNTILESLLMQSLCKLNPYEARGVILNMTDENKQKIFEQIFRHDIKSDTNILRVFELVTVQAEFVGRFSSFKDLSRHTIPTVIYPDIYTTDLGFSYPEIFDEPEFESVRNKILIVRDISENLNWEISQYDKNIAQYAVLQGHHTRWLENINLRSAFQKIALRTTPAAATDVRILMQEFASKLTYIYPEIMKYFNVDYNLYDFARRGEAEQSARRIERVFNSIN